MESAFLKDRRADNPRSLELTPVEETLRQLLLDVAEYIESSPRDSEDVSAALPKDLKAAKLELRFTGGWVRDKLLGVDSHDIDVGINKMTGYQFGLRMKEYLETAGNTEKYGIDKKGTLGGLHKIEANPEKSKHLETVTTRILGLDIDLVNLRKETYSEDSRNPQMEFGTPEKDALRRDATINAMFYNLATHSVEDFTGQGLDDLKRGIIRTPLEPYQTFKDDPLRVLRLIRFASRLDYAIDSAAEQSMSNKDIKDALRAKISRERIGVELEKMLKGPNPLKALQLIDKMGLYSTIFLDPTKETAYEPSIQHWLTPCFVINEVVDGTSNALSLLMQNSEDKYIMRILAALTPWADAPQPERTRPEAKLPAPVATNVAREGIKATNKICDVVTSSVRNAGEITMLKDRVGGRKKYPQRHVAEDPCARDVIGMAIRRWGASWRHQVAFALFLEVKASPESEEEILNGYSTFLTHIKDLGLLEVHTMKPLIDGKQLAKALSTSPGPWMKDALEVVMAWQLRNPGITDPAAAIEEVRAKQDKGPNNGELTTALVDHFLRLTIRPLFAKAQTPTVTAQGRRVTREVLPKKYSNFELDEGETKPWKVKDAYALDLLSWVVKSLDEKTVDGSWPLLVPPILTLIDDQDAAFKARGCELLRLLLNVTPPSLLARTGLGEVMEEAVMPCTAYLPNLTPEEQSYKLLSAAYPALFALADVRYPPDPGSEGRPITVRPEKVKYLNRIFHTALLPSITHLSPLSTHPRLTSLLLRHLPPLLSRLRMHSIPVLQTLIPLLSTILHEMWSGVGIDIKMADTVHVSMAAVKASQELIRVAWPRVGRWRGDLLGVVVDAWIGVLGISSESTRGAGSGGRGSGADKAKGRASSDDGMVVEVVDDNDAIGDPGYKEDTDASGHSDGLRDLKNELRNTVEMLIAATRAGDIEGTVDIDDEIAMMVGADERLRGLFED